MKDTNIPMINSILIFFEFSINLVKLNFIFYNNSINSINYYYKNIFIYITKYL